MDDFCIQLMGLVFYLIFSGRIPIRVGVKRMILASSKFFITRVWLILDIQ